MPWLLLRRPSGTLDVELSAFARPTDRVLSEHVTRHEAVEARERQRERDEREALRAAGQGDLFPC